MFAVQRNDTDEYYQPGGTWGSRGTAERISYEFVYMIRAQMEEELGVPCSVISLYEDETVPS